MDVTASQDKAFKDLHKELSQDIDDQIRNTISEYKIFNRSNLHDMLAHHFHWDIPDGNGGKKLRSTICLLACLDQCGDYKKALPMATAIEIMHNFSLIHDDIVDRDRYRRGRSSIWHKWNVPYAINLGDGLYTMAYLALLNIKAETDNRGALLQLLSESAVKLCHGQQLDMEFETMEKVSLEQYYEMVIHKTATLFECASMGGAMAAKGKETLISKYADFGRNLGMYFQMIDDLKGLCESEDRTGKKGRSDLTMNKKTLPAVLKLNTPELSDQQILATCSAKANEYWDKAIGALPEIPGNSYLLSYVSKIQELLAVKTDCKIKLEPVDNLKNYLSQAL